MIIALLILHLATVNGVSTSLRGLDTMLMSQGDTRRGLNTGYLGNYNQEPEPAVVESAPLAAGCPNDCLGRGACSLDSKCVCAEGWIGDDCSQPACIPECSNGDCVKGQCACHEGWRGVTCATKTCVDMDCSGRGQCMEDGDKDHKAPFCKCDDPSLWEGESCDVSLCPSTMDTVPCSGTGECNVNGKKGCSCHDGYGGADCSTKVCPAGPNGIPCSGVGSCDVGVCVCPPSHRGTACHIKVCARPCENGGACVEGICRCGEGWRGVNCGIDTCPGVVEGGAFCNGHGTCGGDVDHECACEPHWTGAACSECAEGWRGDDCNTRRCPSDCNGDHGFCSSEGECFCKLGWQGHSCEVATCTNNCSGNGVCDNGVCVCSGDWGGEDCSEKTCLNQCSGHGICNDKTCTCEGGFEGQDCSLVSCPGPTGNCNRNGVCDHSNGKCMCGPGFFGEACELKECPPYGNAVDLATTSTTEEEEEDGAPSAGSCNDNGSCDTTTGTCTCSKGYEGLDCGVAICPSIDGVVCSGPESGDCDELRKECLCKDTKYGPACEFNTCYLGCKHDGICNDGQCECPETWTGEDCSVSKCPFNCHGKGVCMVRDFDLCSGFGTHTPGEDACVCEPGRRGVICELDLLGNVATFNSNDESDKYCRCEGNFAGDDCSVCAEGWGGDNCDVNKCPLDCMGRGGCNGKSECECEEGYAGLDCSILACPGKISTGFNAETDFCSGFGTCLFDGSCECAPGHAGEDCSVMPCPGLIDVEGGVYCSGNGECDLSSGTCSCSSEDITGEDCSKHVCPSNCSGDNRGICNDSTGVCTCYEDFLGEDCSLIKCPDNCSGRGACDTVTGTCTCDSPLFEGVGCEKVKCPNDCSGRGSCDDTTGTCLCHDGYATEDCSVKFCSNNCSGHGKCDLHIGECTCDESWRGLGCNVPITTEYSACAVGCTPQCSVPCEQKSISEGHSVEVVEKCYLECTSQCIEECVKKRAEFATEFL